MAEQILHDHIDKVSEVRLIPSSGGVHEVTYGSTVLHSKKETGKHPDPDDVLAKLAG